MPTMPSLERVLFGHVLNEREAQLIGSAAIAVNLAFSALSLGFYALGGIRGDFPLVSLFLTSLLAELGFSAVCLLVWWRRHVALLCLLVAFGLLAVGVATWFTQGGMAPQLIGYNTITVLVAGLLFGSRGALPMAGTFALLATYFLVAAPPADPGLLAIYARPAVVYGIQVACVASAAALAHLGYSRLQGALSAAESHRFALELRSAELDESREHFRLIAEHASDLLSEYTLEGRCLYMNASARSFFGLGGPPLRYEDGLAILHPQDQEFMKSLLGRISQDNNQQDFVATFRARAADGAWHWMEVRAVTFQPPLGPPRIISVTRDISEHKRTEEELERRVAERTREFEEARDRHLAEVRQREEVQESLQRARHLASIGTLAAGIAHEINNPLGSILAAADSAQILWGGAASSRELETLLKKISHEAARCGRVVKSVLALSREVPNERWIGDLNEVVRSARDHLRALAERSGARLDFELDPQIRPFAMNPTELEQVIANLVQNAIESGGPGVRVRVRTEAAPRGVRLRVLDDGPGIAQTDPERIFDPFHGGQHRSGRTGLGLFLVHRIVVGHGGSIEARGRPGSGTEFTIEFETTEATAT